MDAGRHPLIELITNAEVVDCQGETGNFRVRVRKNPRYVREDLCTACDLCVELCPQVGGNEFDVGLKARKAIHRPFPQSVPAAYTIDPEACLNFASRLSFGNQFKQTTNLRTRFYAQMGYQLISIYQTRLAYGRNPVFPKCVSEQFIGVLEIAMPVDNVSASRIPIGDVKFVPGLVQVAIDGLRVCQRE